jgi:hypothetical protein
VKKRIQNDNDKIVERVYQVEDYLDILKDVMDDITTQTHLMNDKELQYDRNNFMKSVRKVDVLNTDNESGYKDYNSDIHTLSILITQLLRYGEILYTERIDDEEAAEE